MLHHPLAQGVWSFVEEDNVDSAFGGQIGQGDRKALLESVA